MKAYLNLRKNRDIKLLEEFNMTITAHHGNKETWEKYVKALTPREATKQAPLATKASIKKMLQNQKGKGR